MEKPIIRIHDLTTNEIIDREMTDLEYEEFVAKEAQTALEEEAKLAAKNALLEKLGITASEAKLLLS